MKNARLVAGLVLVLLLGYSLGTATSQTPPQQKAIFIELGEGPKALWGTGNDIPGLKAEIEKGWHVTQLAPYCFPRVRAGEGSGVCLALAVLEKR